MILDVCIMEGRKHGGHAKNYEGRRHGRALILEGCTDEGRVQAQGAGAQFGGRGARRKHVGGQTI